MKKRKNYYGVKFPIETFKDAYDLFVSKFSESEEMRNPSDLSISYEEVKWEYDTLDEFLSEYPNAEEYRLDQFGPHDSLSERLIIDGLTNHVSVLVQFPDRSDIESIFQVFERDVDKSIIQVESDPIKVFIGHGNDNQWRDLKDHLQDQHGFDVTAYEVGPRAGASVKEVLESMLNESSFAFLIFTGEDIDNEGELHARENVVHELGLFQGRLGFKRAIVLLEEEVREFSNVLGINQIRFSKGNIRETFGDVVATIKRELTREDE